MMLRCAIVDDEPLALSLLESYVNKTPFLQLVGKYSSAVQAMKELPGEEVDLLFLDIQMPGMDGVTLARRLRQRDGQLVIIFITAFSDHMDQGYDVGALHYLLKPITREKLFPVLDRAVEHLRRNERALLIASQGETVRIPLYEIRYVESRLNYVTVHAAREYRFKMPLKEIEGMLDGRFFRAGRSLLINLARIRRIARGEVELLDGEILPLPRGAYEPLNRAFIEYF